MTEKKVGRPKGAKTKDPTQRRAELVEATIAAVRRSGPDASMLEIAAEAGITKSVLYDHFSGKDGLHAAVVEHFGDRLVDFLTSDLGSERTPMAVVRDAVDAFVGFVEADIDVFRFVSRGDRTMLLEAAPVFATLIGGTLRRSGQDSGGASVFAHGALGAVFAATDDWARHRTMSRDDFVDYLAALLWTGLSGVGMGATEDPVDMGPAAAAIEREHERRAPHPPP